MEETKELSLKTWQNAILYRRIPPVAQAGPIVIRRSRQVRLTETFGELSSRI
jgi:hypothetical protein